jgi:trk system potassium uptake protein TrkA
MKMKKKTVAVIGLGMFGLDLVTKLKELGAVVIAIDKDASKVLLVGDIADRSFICDGGNLKSLEEIGIDKVDHAIVAMGQGTPSSVVSTITTTLTLKKLGVEDIIVRSDDDNYKDILQEIGASLLFSPLEIASKRLANVVLADNYEDYFNISDDYSVLQIEVASDYKETSLIDLNAPKEYGVIIVLIKRNGKVFMPKSSDVIKPNDEVFAFGTKEDANKLANELAK